MEDGEYIRRMVEAMTPDDVRGWLQDRRDNCQRIARSKRGEDRKGWLDDVAFFTAAVGLIDAAMNNTQRQ